MQRNLKLVTRYDAARNEYTLFRHNLTAEEANDAVRELAAKFFGLFIVDQQTKHSAADTEQCDACHRDVEHRSHVQPKPSFKRRQKCSTEADRPSFGPVLTSNRSSNYSPSITETVEKENAGRSRA
jgi:hypothetical protein